MKNDIIANPDFKIYDEEVEFWVEKTPQMGDHIRVNRGVYCHHGVYISKDEVIHFTGKEGDSILDWSKPEVIQSDLEYFLKGDKLEVKEYTDEELEDLYPVDHIVAYARACLGDKGYNLVFNNCEHFANTCTLGRFRSKQVENVFGTLFDISKNLLIVYGGKNMGLIGKIGGAIKGLFSRGSSGGGSRSVSNTTSNTNYEPDKVRIAEIEAESRERLAQMEQDRVNLIKESQIELLEFNTNCQIAIEQAKARSLDHMAQTIVNLQQQLNEVASKRLDIIEQGSLPIIKEIEEFYTELGGKIEADHDKYSREKLPQLLNTLNQYEEGSPAFKIYAKMVDQDVSRQFEHYGKQASAVLNRQEQVIASFTQSKQSIIEQTNEITKDLLDTVKYQIEQNGQLIASNKDAVLGIGGNETKLLGE
ncbi:lecithin retinol acyltransferase family protein [Intestinibacter sp.]